MSNFDDPVALAREVLVNPTGPFGITQQLAQAVLDQDARIKVLEHDCDEASDDLVIGLRKRIKELESFTADYKLDQPWRGVIAIMSKSIAEQDAHIKELETDEARVDWMEQFIETGVIETAFEMDGGIHLTLSTVGDKNEVAFRDQNSLREAIDKARAALAGKPERRVTND